MTGNVRKKRNRGRRRILWTSRLMKWLEERGIKQHEVELLDETKNREL